ncbi:MAG: NAD-dependent epimerase/dehydratase family protein [Vicinamibacterales bacterium]
MRVLITGGTGYLGRAIVSALAAAGHEPVVYARTASASGLPGVLVDGDVRDRAALAAAARGADAICHSAALVSLWRPRPRDFDEINVGGLANAIAAAGETRTGRLVYTSSFLALPAHGRDQLLAANDYQRTKVLAAGLADQAAADGVAIVRLYPGVVYGPGVATEGNLVGRLVRDHLAGRLPGLVGADRRWSYAWVDDVAAAHVAALERAPAGSRYALGGDNVPQMRVFEIVRDLTGRALPRRIPFAAATLAGALDAARAALLGRPPLITRGGVAIFREDWSLASDDAVRDLGFRVRPIEEGVAALLASL